MTALRYRQSLVLLRRDLRLHDHRALAAACRDSAAVLVLFVFDCDILDQLPARNDRRVEFIWQSLRCIESLDEAKACLITAHGKAALAVPAIAKALCVEAVYFNHDDEPYALRRDRQIEESLKASSIDCYDFKDHIIFERNEVLSQTGNPYSVFTPYKKAWLKRLAAEPDALNEAVVNLDRLGMPDMQQRQALEKLSQAEGLRVWVGTPPSLEAIGFVPTDLHALPVPLGTAGARSLLSDFAKRIDRYSEARDFPATKGPSYLSVHLRFGTVSIREAARLACSHPSIGGQTWLSELIWRDFYMQILHHFPRVSSRSFKPEYDEIAWEEGPDAEQAFEAWCQGQTGYPLVDAAMRQLLQSGYMHNRLRMVSASFLCKDLGLDWRKGEAWFANKLLDFDLAANNGGWQWAASSGCDAQPYFRIFNPVSQSLKFDKEGRFIRRYLPELSRIPDPMIHSPWEVGSLDAQALGFSLGRDYPHRLVEHDKARLKTLERYQVVKKQNNFKEQSCFKEQSG